MTRDCQQALELMTGTGEKAEMRKHGPDLWVGEGEGRAGGMWREISTPQHAR